MADNTFLQAFQTGASLYDKAQSRKMEQAQMEQQVANFALQREHEDLNQKLGTLKLSQDGYALKEAQNEAAAQVEDAPKLNQFRNDVINWSTSPKTDKVAIEMPVFRSKAANASATDIANKGILMFQNKVAADTDRAAQAAITKMISINAKNIESIQQVPGMEAHVAKYSNIYDPQTRTINEEVFNQNAMLAARVDPILMRMKDRPQGPERDSLRPLLKDAIEGKQVNIPDSIGNQMVVSNKKAQNHFNLLKENFNLPLNETDAKELYVAFQNGAQKIGQKVVDEINSGNQLVKTLESDHNMIQEFEKKYGKGKFDEYVGPIDSFVLKTEAQVQKLTPAQQEAYNIQRQVAQHLQSYRKANFGTALSSAEQAVFAEFSPDPKKPAYSNDILNFANGARKAVEIMVSKNWKSPQVTQFQEEYFKPEFKNGVARNGGAATTPTSTNTAPATSVLKFDKLGNLIQ
jgi:hypothetical protein